jgi:iron(III) transport system ATP-binding protein
MSDRVLDVRGLTHGYGAQPVFRGLDLAIGRGEFAAVLGGSGCGKTTLLRAVAGLLTPQAGSIELDGRLAVRDGRELLRAEERRVGLVFQDYALFPYQSVRENIGFGLAAGQDARVDELLELIGMRELADRRPSELSGGQQQRVALARALAPRPRLLLLDEPFANVDASLRQALSEQLQLLVRGQHTSVLLVTHDRGEALALADRIAVMCPAPGGARIAQCDTPQRVYRQPVSLECARLLGPVCCVPARASGRRAGSALGEVELIEPAQGAVQLLLRPESALFEPDPQGPARVRARLFQGHCTRVLCDTPAGPLSAEFRGAEPLAFDARGRVRLVGPCWALPA